MTSSTRNGRLGDDELRNIDGTIVAADVADDLELMLKAFRDQFGRPMRAPEGYRTYEQQERIFLARHQREPLDGRPTSTWQDVIWYRLPGVAHCAVPGTSPHGLGLAIDLPFEEVPGMTGRWLHAGRFGWVWPGWAQVEPTREPWHLEHAPPA